MKNIFEEKLSSLLKIIKCEVGITAKQITTELGFSKNTLTNWKNGTIPKKSKLIKFLSYVESLQDRIGDNEELEDFLILFTPDDEIEQQKKYNKTNIQKNKETFKSNFNNLIDFLNSGLNFHSSIYNITDLQKQELESNLPNKYEIDSIQKWLASELKVSESQISNWKNGKTFPTLKNLQKIHNFCNLQSDTTFILVDIPKKDFRPLFLKSLEYERHLTEFKQNYLKFIKELIIKSQHIGDFSSAIEQNHCLLTNKDEALNNIRNRIFAKNIIFLNKAFNKCLTNNSISFIEWLFQKIAKYRKFDLHLNEEIKNVKDLKDIADKIEYAFKILDDNRTSELEKWLESPFFLKLVVKYLKEKEPCNEEEEIKICLKDQLNVEHDNLNNLCNLFIELDFENDYYAVEQFFKEFRDLLLYRDYSPKYLENLIPTSLSLETDVISQQLQANFQLLSDFIENYIIGNEVELNYLNLATPLFKKLLNIDNIQNWNIMLETKLDFSLLDEYQKLCAEILEL